MRSIYIVCAFILLTGMPSCKQDTASVQESAGQSAQSPSAEASAQAPADQAASDAALSNGHDYTFLTDKLFHYQAAFGGQKGGEQPYKDEWIDFDPDGTFKAGKLKEQTHTGKWGYNHDTKTLFLRPDVTTYKMSEWKVMFNDQMMVWVGTNTYGDNPIQIKLVRKTELP